MGAHVHDSRLIAGDDGGGAIEFLHKRLCLLFLFIVAIENYRTIVDAPISPLAIKCGGVMSREENGEEVSIGSLAGVELKF